jgi:hypothetical protein
MSSTESSLREKGENPAPGLQPTIPSRRRPWLRRPAIICLSILALVWTVRRANVRWPYSYARERPANVVEYDGWDIWDEVSFS